MIRNILAFIFVWAVALQPNRPYAIQVLSSYFLPGHVSIVHTHSGPEAWWVLEGEQCLERRRKRFGHAPVKAPSSPPVRRCEWSESERVRGARWC